MFLGPLRQYHPSFPAHDVLLFVDTAVNEARMALNSANLRRYTELQYPKAGRRRLKAVQSVVRVLLGDPDIVCGTNTKGEVCLSGGSCTCWWRHRAAGVSVPRTSLGGPILIKNIDPRIPPKFPILFLKLLHPIF